MGYFGIQTLSLNLLNHFAVPAKGLLNYFLLEKKVKCCMNISDPHCLIAPN